MGGDKVAARVESTTHPVLEFMRFLPMWREAPLPKLMLEAVSEFHTGKIGGVVKKGRFLVQRPSGAIPERIAAEVEFLLVPRQRKRRTALSAFIGMVSALCLGTAMHSWKWLHGRPMDQGRFAWVNLVGYTTIVVVFLTPLMTWPCYSFSISLLSTATSIECLDLLFYFDLLTE